MTTPMVTRPGADRRYLFNPAGGILRRSAERLSGQSVPCGADNDDGS